MFKLPDVIQDIEEEPGDLTLVQRLEIEKKKKSLCQGRSAYADLAFIPNGSQYVEALWAITKFIVSDHRKSLLPRTLEILIFLKMNRRFWDINEVHTGRI